MLKGMSKPLFDFFDTSLTKPKGIDQLIETAEKYEKLIIDGRSIHTMPVKNTPMVNVVESAEYSGCSNNAPNNEFYEPWNQSHEFSNQQFPNQSYQHSHPENNYRFNGQNYRPPYNQSYNHNQYQNNKSQKYCDYHNSITHNTQDCFSLRKQSQANRGFHRFSSQNNYNQEENNYYRYQNTYPNGNDYRQRGIDSNKSENGPNNNPAETTQRPRPTTYFSSQNTQQSVNKAQATHGNDEPLTV